MDMELTTQAKDFAFYFVCFFAFLVAMFYVYVVIKVK